MKKLVSIFIVCVMLVGSNINVYAKEFNSEKAIQTYKESMYIKDAFLRGMDNNFAITNAKVSIDYLNGSNVLTVVDYALKIALSNTMVGNTVHAIILYNWIELSFNDIRFALDDNLQKDIDIILLKIKMLRSQIYSYLDQTNTTNLLNVENLINEYYNNTPTRCMAYNQKILNKVYNKPI